MRYWITLLLVSTAFLAAAPPTVVTENDPATLVDGVSVITGDFYLGEEDYSIAGEEPIPIRRFYLSAIGGLNQYPHLTAVFVFQMNALMVHEPNGTLVTYSADPKNKYSGLIGDQFYAKKKRPLKFHSNQFATTSPGVSNTSTGTISAKSQLKNQTIIFNPSSDKKGKSFSLYTSEGTVRRYVNYESQEKSDFGPYGKAYLTYYYRLKSETLPNGRILHYDWDSNNRLTGMRTSNPQNTKIFAQVPFPKIDPKQLNLSYSLNGSDGRSVAYAYRQTGKKSSEFAQVVSPERADQQFTHSANRLSQISLPNGRTVALQYADSKVSSLLAPLGLDGSLIPYYKFVYDENAKKSSCVDILGNKTSYYWNNNYRLTKIDRFEGDQLRKNSETLVWEETNLRCKVFYGELNSPVFAKTFSYDAQGNVVQEIFWGNISGKGTQLCIDSDGMPVSNEVERAVTKNIYEARNLLEKREDPSGLITAYTYLPHAELLSSKTLSANGSLFAKTTYIYDSDHTLIREIVEDGTVGYKIQEIIPRQSAPYIDLPDLILEKYKENGVERLLRKTKLYYTNGAFVSQKDIYDADDLFQYSLYYKYDAKGRLLEETNAIGQKSIAVYDEVGNKIYFKDCSGKKETFYDYDLVNRLTKRIEKGLDGIVQEFIYAYDQKHNLTSEIDSYGNEILYEYDLFGNKTKTAFPLQQIWGGGACNSVTQTQHDSMGNPVLQIDAKGNKIKTSYNAFGKPVQVIYPDGATKENSYNLDGTLAFHIDPLGVETRYKYDALGRVIEKRVEDAIETFVYDGSYLIEKVDAEDTKTFYQYDGAGRKISEEIAGEIVRFTYDSLGRLASRIEGDLTTSYRYDLLDRLVKETKTDPSGKLLQITQYDYDTAGNQIAVIQGKNSAETFEYDSFNRQIVKIDPLGAAQPTAYEIIQNNLGQRVLQKTTTDPLGLQTIEVFDAQHRLVSLEKRKDAILLTANTYYDLIGQKTVQEFTDRATSRTILNQWEYNSRNRLTALMEGSNSKITKYEYNLRGDKTAIIKPDGIVLTFEYNPLGHLVHLFSSDKTVDHQLEVDRLGRLLGFDGTTRILDAQGRILEERFLHGPSIQNLYDTRGRKIICSIPSFELKTQYQHGPLDLEKIFFQNQVHSYTAYDLAGNILEENSSLGSLLRTYDPAQRPLSIKNAHFPQKIEEYDAVGNILRMDIDGVKQTYDYDDLYQLVSETGSFCHNFTFDTLHNRLSKDTEQYALNALNQAVSHCTYDLNGNPTQMGSMRLFYDALDRLIRVETPDAVQTFTYDYLNRCVDRTVQGERPLFFLYDGQNEIGSFDETLRDFRVLGRAETAEIGAAVAVLVDHVLYAPIHDLQGNVAALIPIDQGTSSKYRYSAFGEELLEGLVTSPWRFSSKRVDPLTGFVNYGRRYYVPNLGRWLTPDPLGFSAGINLYAFVQNDPLTHFDEYGLYAIPIIYKPWQGGSEGAKLFGVAAAHEVATQTIGVGRFCASAPYHLERGINYLTGRDTYTFAGWQEKQTQFFSKAEDWMYRALPTDRTNPDYLRYRRDWIGGVIGGLELGSSLVGGYGLARGGLKAATMGVHAWKLRRGAFVAGEKLALSPTLTTSPMLKESFANKGITSNKIWTSTKKATSVQNAYRHWKDHGCDFSTLQNSKQYVEAARKFTQSAPPGTLTKIRPNGDLVFYNQNSNTFATTNYQGLPRTMYKPNPSIHNYSTSLEYFYGQ